MEETKRVLIIPLHQTPAERRIRQPRPSPPPFQRRRHPPFPMAKTPHFSLHSFHLPTGACFRRLVPALPAASQRSSQGRKERCLAPPSRRASSGVDGSAARSIRWTRCAPCHPPRLPRRATPSACYAGAERSLRWGRCVASLLKSPEYHSLDLAGVLQIHTHPVRVSIRKGAHGRTAARHALERAVCRPPTVLGPVLRQRLWL